MYVQNDYRTGKTEGRSSWFYKLILIDIENTNTADMNFRILNLSRWSMKLSTQPFHRLVNIQMIFMFCLHVGGFFGSRCCNCRCDIFLQFLSVFHSVSFAYLSRKSSGITWRLLGGHRSGPSWLRKQNIQRVMQYEGEIWWWIILLKNEIIIFLCLILHLSQCCFVHHKSHWTASGMNLSYHGMKLVTTCLKYGTATDVL
jgi:hypothetical protein